MGDELQQRARFGRQFNRDLFGAVLNAKQVYLGVQEAKSWYDYTKRVWNKMEEHVATPENIEVALDKAIQHFRPETKEKNIAVNYKMPSAKTKSGTRKGKKSGKTKTKQAKAVTKVDKRQDKMIKSIYKTLRSDQARHTHRRREVSALGANAGQQVHSAMPVYTNTNLLEGAMAFLRYYDPSNPGTLVTANASTGTYSRQVHFESIYEKLRVRNNYQVPAHITIYSCTPKNDTNITVLSYFSDGITDQASGTVASTSPLIYLNDIRMVKDNWKCKAVKTVLLQAGAETSATRSCKAFDYDPSNVDTHSSQFQSKYGAHMWVVRVEGTIAHDTTLAQYLTTQAQVDCMLDMKFVMTYDAGVNLDDYSVDDNSSASFTNGGVVSNKPVSDNQSYSVA